MSEHKHKPLELSIPDGGTFNYGHPGGEALTRRLLELCALPAGSDVLDFGCGAGETLLLMRDEYGFNVTGTDADRAAVNAAKLRDSALNVVHLVNNVVDFPSLSFDAVVAECSLSVVGMRAEYLHEIYCVLRRGGKLAISDVFARGEEDIIQNELERSGFRLLVWEYHTQALRDYAAQLLMDGRKVDCERYGKDTGYYLAVAAKS
ncbi:MAG: class I SAM-dependent methyltransferase [Oscillospiraceae bacterium]|jgi:cyclopropane fatty-acyl-phospholipid synthase-like methyltransferase|nr:class I SAM-dependent methyltransferase [Oscillospiraceae bacterium]